MSEKLLVIGSGGHAKVILRALKRRYAELGLVDPALPIGTRRMDVPVIGTDDDLPALFRQGWTSAALGVGSVTSTALRERLAAKLLSIGFSLPAIVDEAALLGEGVTLGEGAFVNCGAIVQAGASIGRFAILNTGSIVEHDCVIGDFAHISSGAVVLGGASVGFGSLVGGGSVVRQGIVIGSRTVVGAGSVVVQPLPDDCIAFGNPCKVRRTE